MTTINILIYTDSSDFALIEDTKDLRLTTLKRLLETKRMGFAEFKLEVINRYEAFLQPGIPEEPKPLQKLTRELLERFDEVWFFGWYQSNVEQDFHETYGSRENELDEKEVADLTRWMAWGGVLMSGDHSLYKPFGKKDDPRDTFQCLGRALGHLVPRAGKLRKWDGPPTINEDDSFNTLVRTGVSGELQGDVVPQSLRLTRSEPNVPPHPIFLGERRNIDIFPDHAHEGLVVMPKLDGDWPPFNETDESKKAKPEFVAYGCDKRSCQSIPVLAVYDGDKWGVGRIASDSSWHHYVNVNLNGFTDTRKDAPLDLMAQFFQNLALYLAPLSKRQQMSHEMVKWLVEHPEVKEERGNDPEIVGRVGLRHLLPITTRYEREELFPIVITRETEQGPQQLGFSSLPSERSLLPSQDFVVGSIINRYFRNASERLSPDAAPSFAMSSAEDLIAAGLADAFDGHREWLVTALAEIADLDLKIVDGDNPTLVSNQEALTFDSQEGKMAHTICRGDGGVTWENSKLGGAKDGDGKFHIDDHADGGNVEITGVHPGRGGASLVGMCNGQTISFALVDRNTNTMIGYLRGRYSTVGPKDFIKGKFIRLDVTEPASDAAASDSVALLGADDWEADKTT